MASKFQFQRSKPEAEGISPAAVLNFVEALEQHTHPLDQVQSFMLLRHGKVVAEGWWAPYNPETPHWLYSLSKSFASTAIGLAVAEGRLTVDDPVLKFFPDEAPANPSENLKAMRVRHLLAMNTGHDIDTTERVFGGKDDYWARTFLSLPVEHQPGSWFVYNTAATYMLSAIITKLTGEALVDYLRPRLFEPLGIEHPTWDTDPRGINLGGTGLHITTEDIARFGQMYLRQGMWQGQQVVPAAWVAEATAAHSDNSNTQTNPDWVVGYGYQFWRGRHDTYRGDGAFGQYCVVMAEQEAVLAITSGVRDMQSVLDKVWDHLLPAMQPQPLPADAQAYDALCAKLAGLSLPLPHGQASSPQAKQWAGRTYKLERNELALKSVAVELGEKGSTLVFHDSHGAHRLKVGYGAWLKGSTDLRGRGEEPVAAAGAWITANTYEVRVCYYASEVCPVFRLSFADGGLQLEVEPNVSWGSTEPVVIGGRG